MYISLPSSHVLCLRNILYIPCIFKNIISVPVLSKENYEFSFKDNVCYIYFGNNIVGKGILLNGLYHLCMIEGGELNEHILINSTKKRKRENSNSKYLWHLRLGHIGEKRINKLGKMGLFDFLDHESIPTCQSCILGKMTKSPFVGQSERAADLLGIIHSDVCGPFNEMARGNFHYFITFTDDLSRYGFVYLMKHKSESFEKFKEFKAEVENQLGKNIKALRSDRGGEYLSTEFGDFLKASGIISQLTPPSTPQHNGVSERRNRTLLDMVRSMMSYTDLSISFWGHAILTVVYLLNKVPSKSFSSTPYEIWYGKQPSLNHIKIWGCPAFIKKLKTDKLETRSVQGRFVGYPKESLGYQFYLPDEQRVVISRHAIFLEKEFIQEGGKGRKIVLEEGFPEQQTTMDQVQKPSLEDPQPFVTLVPRRSSRISHPLERYGSFLNNA